MQPHKRMVRTGKKKTSQQQWRGKFTARNTSFAKLKLHYQTSVPKTLISLKVKAHLVKRLPFKITPYLTWPKISIMRSKIKTASPPS